MTRKPPVVAIRGGHVRDLVTQADLRQLATLQALEWEAQRATQKVAMEIERRIAHGAGVEAGEFGFDAELKMARTRKEKAG